MTDTATQEPPVPAPLNPSTPRKATQLELDRYRQLAQDIVKADPRNRIRHICVDGNGDPYKGSHSKTDFETDLASYLLAASKAGLIKICHRYG